MRALAVVIILVVLVIGAVYFRRRPGPPKPPPGPPGPPGPPAPPSPVKGYTYRIGAIQWGARGDTRLWLTLKALGSAPSPSTLVDQKVKITAIDVRGSTAEPDKVNAALLGRELQVITQKTPGQKTDYMTVMTEPILMEVQPFAGASVVGTVVGV